MVFILASNGVYNYVNHKITRQKVIKQSQHGNFCHNNQQNFNNLI